MNKLESFKATKNKILDLTLVDNIKNLSTREQKNIAILIIARNELERLKEYDLDEFALKLKTYLVNNVPSLKELERLFESYYEEKNPFKKNSIFKRIKPIEPLAVYLSEVAAIFNKEDKSTEFTIKAFAYQLIHDWFEAEGKVSTYLEEVNELKLEAEIYNITTRAKEYRNEINKAFDNAIEVSEFIRDYVFKIILPKRCIKGTRKKR